MRNCLGRRCLRVGGPRPPRTSAGPAVNHRVRHPALGRLRPTRAPLSRVRHLRHVSVELGTRPSSDSSTACIWRPSRVCRNTRCWWTWPPRCSPTTSPHSSVWPRSPTPTGRCSGAASEPMPMSPCVPSCRVCCWPSATSSTWSTTRCTSSGALFTASLQGALRRVIPIEPGLMRAWPTRRAGLKFGALAQGLAAHSSRFKAAKVNATICNRPKRIL